MDPEIIFHKINGLPKLKNILKFLVPLDQLPHLPLRFLLLMIRVTFTSLDSIKHLIFSLKTSLVMAPSFMALYRAFKLYSGFASSE